MLAIIGGSGLYQLKALQNTEIVQPETPFGLPSAEITCGDFWGQSILFMPRHGRNHSVPPHKINYRANLFALKQLGATDIIAVNAVGGITELYSNGQLVVPDQIIDYSYGREQTFFDGSGALDNQDLPFNLSLGHVDFSYPYTEALREDLVSSCANLNIPCVAEAVYGCTQGPRLETAAEIDRLAQDGCDIVGMTAMPEAGLARELSLNYASVCLVVNAAAGCSESEITMAEIQSVLTAGMGKIEKMLEAVAEQRL